jgi:predicted PurR-regulated permease PerM
MSRHTHTLPLVAGAVLLYGGYTILAPFAFPLVCGLIISLAARPLFDWLQRSMSAGWSSLVTIITILIAIVFPLSLLGFAIFQESQTTALALQGSLSEHGLLEYQQRVSSLTGIPLTIDVQEISRSALTTVGQQSLRLASSLASGLFGLILALMTTSYLLTNHHQVHSRIIQTSPFSQADTKKILDSAKAVIVATVNGNLLLVLAHILAACLWMTLLGLPAPLILGTLFGIASLIPGIGTALIWLPIALYFLTTIPLFALITCLCALLQFVGIDMVLGPKLIEKRTQLHPFVILLGVIGGVSQFGLLGLIIGPTLMALASVGAEIVGRAVQSQPE